MTAFKPLINSLLQYNNGDGKLMDVPTNRPVQYCNNLESKLEFYLVEEKLFFCWPLICFPQRVVKLCLGIMLALSAS